MKGLFGTRTPLLYCLSFLLAHFSSAQVKNTKLGDIPFSLGVPLNPSVAASEKKAGNIMVGISLDRSFYTLDSGRTWSETAIAGTHLKGIDPSIVVDVKGDFHFLESVLPDTTNKSIANGIATRMSFDEGKSWTEPIWIGLPAGNQKRRPRAGTSLLRGNLYATWTEFEIKDDTCYSNLMYSLSSNDGKRWDNPVRINQHSGQCGLDDRALLGAGMVVNSEGKQFTAWSLDNNLYFDRSYDLGKTFLNTDMKISKVEGGSVIEIPGVMTFNGEPVLAVDKSASFFRTSLYVVYADQTNGPTDTEIWMLRTTTRGDLWSQPLRVNSVGRDKHQFMPWLTVDESTGIIYVAYYDRRNYDDSSTEVYLSYSVNGGKDFSEMKISESPFKPSADKVFTDHIGIAASKGLITIAWARQESDGNSVMVTVVKQSDLVKPGDAPKLQQLRK